MFQALTMAAGLVMAPIGRGRSGLPRWPYRTSVQRETSHVCTLANSKNASAGGRLVEGFTDSTGSNSFNQDLSDRRARAVRTALMDTGISADRITNRGYGDTFPVATNATAAGRQLNRRVEIVVSDDGKMIAPR